MSAEPKQPATRWQIDRQDVLLVIGVVSLIGGVAAWSRPAAAVLLGLLCLGAVWLIEVSLSKQGNPAKGRG